MTFDVRIRPEAEQDMAEAASWYEQQQRGLGQDFLDETLAVFMRLAETPLGYDLVHRSARRALLTVQVYRWICVNVYRKSTGRFRRVPEESYARACETLNQIIAIGT